MSTASGTNESISRKSSSWVAACRSRRRTSCPARRTEAATSSTPSGSSRRKISLYMSPLGCTHSTFMSSSSLESRDRSLSTAARRIKARSRRLRDHRQKSMVGCAFSPTEALRRAGSGEPRAPRRTAVLRAAASVVEVVAAAVVHAAHSAHATHPAHPSHAAHSTAAAARGRLGLLLGLLGDHGLGGEQEAGDRGSVLQRAAGYLGGVDDAGRGQ